MGSVFISIPVWPPIDADDLYARTHGKVVYDDESDTPMVKVHVFDSDRVLVRGLDGMYAGQSIELLIGGDAGYYIDITPLKASTHATADHCGMGHTQRPACDHPRRQQDAPPGARAVHDSNGPARSSQHREENNLARQSGQLVMPLEVLGKFKVVVVDSPYASQAIGEAS